MKISCLVLAGVLAELVERSLSFQVVPTRKAVLSNEINIAPLYARHSEFSVLDEDDELPQDVIGSDYMVIQKEPEPSAYADNQTSGSTKRAEYAALATGTVVQVQIGDISLARKAWKKRRRTGSPLLVPCSILNVDQRSMVRWNLMFLLEKFGKATTDGVRISVPELSQKYRTFLRSSLQKHAMALGYESNEDMVADLFNKKVQESYGIRLITQDSGRMILKAPISRMKAQKRTAGTPVVQFRDFKTGDYGDADTLTHTGFVRTRRPDQDPSDRSYHFLPLSAALRVSQKDDIETGNIEEGSIHSAVIFEYDLLGDAGSPLLTLSLNPRGAREKLKVKPDRKYQPIENPQVEFKDLKIGNGPYKAKVVCLLKGKALIDMDVGRRTSSEGLVRVLGALPFKESFTSVGQESGDGFDGYENFDEDFEYEDDLDGASADDLFNFNDEDFDEEDGDNESIADELLTLRSSESFEDGTFEDNEEEEDVSDFYSLNDDGLLSYTDPSTGETIVMGSIDDDDEDEIEGVGDDDGDLDIANDDDGDLDFDAAALFEKNEDGSISFIDPESGEALNVEQGDEEFEDMMMIKSLIDKYSAPPPARDVDDSDSTESKMQSYAEEANLKPGQKFVTKRLRVGEEIEVYVRSVSKQSGQFVVTMNSTVKGRKARELKKESGAMKKLDRLKKSLGGSLQKIYDRKGQECSGTVKATSNTGEWVYVQPHLDGLPVGVATICEGLETSVSPGDSVLVRIAGIDEERGQLAMDLLGKQ